MNLPASRVRWLLALLLVSAPALAHDLVRDGNVGALLHLEPDDAPAARAPTRAWFEVNGRGAQAITLANCVCTLNVYAGRAQAGAVSTSLPRLTTEKNRLRADLIFPVVGAYTLVLTGQPRSGASFAPFRLEWVVRAE